ncbi:site-specific integrase [Photobacterium phosphoreum]|uniref:Site-specific integrase n=1 Tax=Photobacterium phosphoreum TaxID=659 RepID=A0AAW4ZVP6_PHOPO|nr:site-specific integrase [Photobacterium phosphoreum]MCD9493199.1 site-specific integrase [Photobacterium phosphoreum]MCF2192450.1 site-specific integrase [Photobacterium phosphoreum]MCF2304096.1 site-specific integrase [Photobacterium phosphoreum]
MAKFGSKKDSKAIADTQAKNIMKQISEKRLGTDRNDYQSLKTIAEYANEYLNCGLKEITQEQAIQYLSDRSETHSQSSLNRDRLALQKMFHSAKVKDPLAKDKKLQIVKSDKNKNNQSRNYTERQIEKICDHQSEKYAFSTQLAAAAGLRAHELLTIHRLDECPAMFRAKNLEAKALKFKGMDGIKYTVIGKGGLIREINIPKDLAGKLEERRLENPKIISDRTINYVTKYDLAGGNRWSSSFTQASNRAMGWSNGGHGLRHTYAQNRMKELQQTEKYAMALAIVSQEIGHFRSEVTLVYLR